jgi:hypothetical protein
MVSKKEVKHFDDSCTEDEDELYWSDITEPYG